MMFLEKLNQEQLTMIAKYQNLYFKNRIFNHVLTKDQWFYDEKKNVSTWVYDNIYIYLYRQKYT